MYKLQSYCFVTNSIDNYVIAKECLYHADVVLQHAFEEYYN